jgi:hypothetical protein
MATWQQITQSGELRWTLWGGGITNHEVFAFTLAVSDINLGALLSDAAVYLNQNNSGGQLSYSMNLSAVDESGDIVDDSETIIGNFVSKTI